MSSQYRKTTESYWNSLWSNERTLPEPFSHNGLRASSAYRKGIHAFFCKIFSKTEPEYRNLLEVGCARSQFLPYFAIEHSLSVTGLDYSPPGCEASRHMLKRAGVDGVIYCADVFSPPSNIVGHAEIVA